MKAHLYLLSRAIRQRDGFSMPQPADHLPAREQQFITSRVAIGGENEVVGIPAGRQGQVDSPSRKVIDHCPLLGYPDRMVHGKHHAAGPQPNAAGRHRERRGQHRGVGI
jgi:hypothetical protein